MLTMDERGPNNKTSPHDAGVNALSTASASPPVTFPSTCRSPLSVASGLYLLEAQWSDISEDNLGVANGIFGVEWEEFSSKQLRIICTRLNIKGVRNAKKQDMVDRIVRTHKNKKAYGVMLAQVESKMPANQKDKTPRKQIQCPFHLMNVLFSDKFLEDFANLGNLFM